MMRPRDTTEQADAVQIEIYRRMAPAGRLRIGLELTELSQKLLTTGIHRRHPEYTADELRLAAIRAWLGPELFRRAYPTSPELEP
ncbi:MAG TPA: hypothetical protein VGQ83_21215 [Polyangia bacterium]|jgi:hypothetical protein